MSEHERSATEKGNHTPYDVGRAVVRIEGKLDRIEAKVDEINSTVASHEQTLHGVGNRGGVIDEVKDVKERLRTLPTPGVVPMRTVWIAVGSITGVAMIFLAILGLS